MDATVLECDLDARMHIEIDVNRQVPQSVAPFPLRLVRCKVIMSAIHSHLRTYQCGIIETESCSGMTCN